MPEKVSQRGSNCEPTYYLAHRIQTSSGAYGLAMIGPWSVPASPRRSFQELVDIACPGADRDALT